MSEDSKFETIVSTRWLTNILNWKASAYDRMEAEE